MRKLCLIFLTLVLLGAGSAPKTAPQKEEVKNNPIVCAVAAYVKRIFCGKSGPVVKPESDIEDINFLCLAATIWHQGLCSANLNKK